MYMGERITVDIDNTLLEAAGDELLPGSEKLLALLHRTSLEVIIWTIGDSSRINDLIDALERSDSYFKDEALRLVLSAACYSRGDRIPEPNDSSLDEDTVAIARAKYNRGIKVPLAIGARVTIDDDSEVINLADEMGYTAIDPSIGRPREKDDLGINSWASNIVNIALANA